MFLMVQVLIMMIIIMIGSGGIAGGRVDRVKYGDRGNQNCDSD